MMTEDFSVFFNPGELSNTALFGVSGSQVSVNGIFENPYQDVNEADITGISSTMPKFTCPFSEVSGYTEGDPVSIDTVNYIIRDIRPDGTGLAEILLYKAP